MATSTVFDPTPAYTSAESAAALPRMLMGGTAALRADPKRWLPPNEAEELLPGAAGEQSDYDRRVSRAVVEPYYRRAILRDVASVLGKPVVLQQDVPQEIRGTDERGKDGWWENIDLRGNDGTVFLREVVKDAAGDRGFSAVLVDHPPVGGDAKLSDLQAAGLRPFWRHYKARDILESADEYVNGRQRALTVRLREEAPEGKERVRVLHAAPWKEATSEYVGFVTFELWERDKSANSEAAQEGSIIERGNMKPHREIPLVPLYYERTGFFEGQNPYRDLAELNLKHTRQDCDVSEDLSISSGAQLHRTGLREGEELQRVIGPRRLLFSREPGATAEWLERSGSAASVYLEYQASLEAKMERLANEPHVRRTGNETATGRAIDTAEAKTEIQARCLAVRDFAESLLMLTASYNGHESGGQVDVTSPMTRMDRDLDGIDQLKDCAVKGWVRPETVLAVMQKQGILPDDVDIEEEVELAGASKGPGAGLRPPPGPNGHPPALARVRAAIEAAEGAGGVGGGGAAAQ